MEQLVFEVDDPGTPPNEPVVVEDYCAYCYAPAEEGPIVNGRRYCSGRHASLDQPAA